MSTYKENTSIYTPSQRSRPNFAEDRIPASFCKLLHAKYVSFQESWDKLGVAGIAPATHLNNHSLEANTIEGVLQFDPAVTVMISREGIRGQVADHHLTAGDVVRDAGQAIVILQDTRKAMDKIYKHAENPGAFILTMEAVCA